MKDNINSTGIVPYFSHLEVVKSIQAFCVILGEIRMAARRERAAGVTVAVWMRRN